MLARKGHKPYEMEKNETRQTADMYLVMCKVVLVRTSRDTKRGVGGDVIEHFTSLKYCRALTHTHTHTHTHYCNGKGL
jgi:hypothetical protein